MNQLSLLLYLFIFFNFVERKQVTLSHKSISSLPSYWTILGFL